ncbi:hypothetical protein [Nonomuraea africana]|uniref:Uncharacterized protein n=1 Tax=Nonomuraea africana TaxID=46171 RepID=A0ABR9KBU1_9ACTN|nr:hypothetical protein [Nonomuraea africana]MBE1559474.1 hypothetical protein [Nonomuraea africana]
MATWRVPRGSAAFSLVVGLTLLAFLLVGSTPAWYGSDPAHRASAVTGGEVWAPGAWIAQSSNLPPAAAGVREHVLPLWPPPRHSAPESAAGPPSPQPAGWPEVNPARSPRQSAHSTAGPRSPPAI